MQTLLDQMIKDLIRAALCAAIISSLTHVKYCSMNNYVAIAMIWSQYASGILFFGQILSTFITRYIIIYYPSVVNDVEETRIMVISRYVVMFKRNLKSNLCGIILSQIIAISLLHHFNNLRNPLSRPW